MFYGFETRRKKFYGFIFESFAEGGVQGGNVFYMFEVFSNGLELFILRVDYLKGSKIFWAVFCERFRDIARESSRVVFDWEMKSRF